jgi:hypothetical protein
MPTRIDPGQQTRPSNTQQHRMVMRQCVKSWRIILGCYNLKLIEVFHVAAPATNQQQNARARVATEITDGVTEVRQERKLVALPLVGRPRWPNTHVAIPRPVSRNI